MNFHHFTRSCIINDVRSQSNKIISITLNWYQWSLRWGVRWLPQPSISMGSPCCWMDLLGNGEWIALELLWWPSLQTFDLYSFLVLHQMAARQADEGVRWTRIHYPSFGEIFQARISNESRKFNLSSQFYRKQDVDRLLANTGGAQTFFMISSVTVSLQIFRLLEEPLRVTVIKIQATEQTILNRQEENGKF